MNSNSNSNSLQMVPQSLTPSTTTTTTTSTSLRGKSGLYECPRCAYSTPYRHSLGCHLRRKNTCPHPPHRSTEEREAVDAFIADRLFGEAGAALMCVAPAPAVAPSSSSSSSTTYHACNGCGIGFRFRSCLSRHRKTCHKVTDKTKDEDDLTRLQRNYEQLQEQVTDLTRWRQRNGNNETGAAAAMTVSNTNTNNNYNNQTNVTNNIQINALGKEDLSRIITPELVDTCIRRTTKGLVELMENIHFNPHAPVNHNLRASLQHPEHVKYHDGEDWVFGPRNRVVRDVVDSSHTIMSNRYDENQQQMRRSMSSAMYSFVDKWMNKMTKANAQVYVDVMSEVYCSILNKTKRMFEDREDISSRD